MRFVSFIYKKTVINKILTHLNENKEKKIQRAPPVKRLEYTEPIEIVPYKDG